MFEWKEPEAIYGRFTFMTILEMKEYAREHGIKIGDRKENSDRLK